MNGMLNRKELFVLNMSKLWRIECENINIRHITYGFAVSMIVLILVGLILLQISKCKNKSKQKWIIVITAVNILITMFAIGVRRELIIYLLYTLGAIFLGRLILVGILQIKKDNFIYCFVEYFIGIYFAGCIYFILLHRCMNKVIPVNTSKWLIVLLIFISFIYNVKNDLLMIRVKNLIMQGYVNQIIMFINLTIFYGYFIVFHFNSLYSWGWNGDKNSHLIIFFIDNLIKFKGFPFESLYPLGFQLAINVPNTFIGSMDSSLIIKSYDYFGLINLFVMMILPFYFSLKELHLNKANSFLASMLTVFCGALGGPIINSYLGFVNISTGMYHNTTLFFALPLIQFNMYFLYKYIVHKEKSYLLLSIIFLDIHFFIKSSGYMMIAPVVAMILLKTLVTEKKKVHSTIICGLLLILPAMFWFSYPKLFNITKLETNTKISYFGEVYIHLFDINTSVMKSGNYPLKLMIILFCSFLGIILPIIFGNIKAKNHKRFFYALLLPLLVISILMSFVLIEGNARRYDGNFLWQVPLIGVCILPFICELCSNINNKITKSLTYIILFLHIFSGIWHLIMFDIHAVI